MDGVKNKKLEPFVRRLEALQEHADFSGYLDALRSSLDVKTNREHRIFFFDLESALTGGDVREGREKVAAHPGLASPEPIDRYLHESDGLLRDLERSLPAHDMANVFYESIESDLREGRVDRALESMRNEKLVVPGWWMLPSIMLLAGLGAGALGVYDLVTATESVSWPTTQGTVMISKVVITRTTGGSGRVGMPGSRVGGEGSSTASHIYTPEVVYEYAVGDRSYRNDRVAIAHVGDEEEANAIVARYPVDATVTVHYDPDDPGTSVLEAGTRSSTYVGLGLCAGFLSVALVALLLPRLRRKTLADRHASEKKG